MDPAEAAREIALSNGFRVDETVVLHASNKLTVRLLPADVVARVAPLGHDLDVELDLARRLDARGAPVVAPDPRVAPRVYTRGEVAVTFWTYAPPGPPVAPEAYAVALADLHAALRQVDPAVPLVADRVASALDLLVDRRRTPELGGADRTLLTDTLQRLGDVVARSEPQQALDGEPHPGNLLATPAGARFVDFETCCRGPVEFDVAHAPTEVAGHYPGLDADLLRACRTLVLAMITTWRWDVADRFPAGARLGREWLEQLKLSSPNG